MRPHLSRRILAATLVLGMASLPANLPALAGSEARLEGRVLGADGITPLSGVIVTLLDSRSREVFSSQPTSDRGSFHVSASSPGGYTLLAETSAGAFLAPGSVTLREGSNAPIALTLKLAQEEPQEGPKEGEGEAPPPETQEQEKKKGLAGWPKWVIVGGIVVGGLLVIDAVTSEEKSSPSGF